MNSVAPSPASVAPRGRWAFRIESSRASSRRWTGRGPRLKRRRPPPALLPGQAWSAPGRSPPCPGGRRAGPAPWPRSPADHDQGLGQLVELHGRHRRQVPSGGKAGDAGDVGLGASSDHVMAGLDSSAVDFKGRALDEACAALYEVLSIGRPAASQPFQPSAISAAPRQPVSLERLACWQR